MGIALNLRGQGMRTSRAALLAARSSGLVCGAGLSPLAGRCRLHPESCGVVSRRPRLVRWAKPGGLS
jgi:hypothetical protein